MKKNKLSVISFILALVMSIMLVPSAMAADGAPVIKKLTPEDGTKNVQTMGTVFQVVFSEDIDQKLIESAGSVSIDNGARILETKLIDPKTANIYITDLKPGVEYTLKFNPTIKSTAGVAIEQVSKKFTTAGAPLTHQIPGGDMSDPIWRKAFNDAGANGNSISFIKEGDNDVMKWVPAWVDAPVLHTVAVEGGVTYKARARVKSDQAQAMRVVMQYSLESDDEWYRIGAKWDQQVPAGEWVDIDSTFAIPSDIIGGTGAVEITARVKGTTVLVDDFQFYEVNTDEPSEIMDPGSAVSDKVVTTIEDGSKDLTAQKLEGLGIYSKGEYAEKMTVSRETFSKYMAKILKADGVKSTANFENYTDVDEGYDGHIGTMVEMNILTANDKGELRPDDAITFSEVCRAFVVALGHQKALEEKTPIVAASNLGIRNLTGLKAASEVTYADLNGLMDSFIKAECLYDEFGSFKTGEVLKTKLGVTKLKGIVEATSQTSLDNGQGIKAGYVKIDGKTYKLIDTDVSDVLGKYVTYYVQEIDGENCVLYIGEIEKNNKMLKLNAYDVISYANNVYGYLVEEQASGERAELESDKIVIYNGRTARNYQATDLLPTYGWIELVDNDKNGKYDVVKITDYETYVVESYDPTTQTIRDKFENKFITIDPTAEILVYKNGRDAQLSGVQNGNVVTVEKSIDGKRVVLHVSSNVTEGDIGKVETDDDRLTKFVSFYDIVHGDQIQTHVPCVKGYAGNANTTAGDGGTFYIDAFGQIAAFARGTGSWTYGYIKKARLWDEEFVRIEMFTQNNTHETIDCVENVKIDSYRTTGHDDTFSVLASAGASATVVEPELIMYKTNKDGLIKQIKTARDTTATDDFRQVRTITGGKYNSGNGMIVIEQGTGGFGTVYVDDDTLLLSIPSDANLSDTTLYSFSQAKPSLLWKGTDYTVYNQSESRLTADLLVVKDKTVWNQDARSQGIVTGIKTKVGADGETITVVTTTTATLQLSENSVADVNNMTATNGATGLTLRKGDYIGWRTRSDGYIHDMQIIFKGDTKQNLQGSSGTYAIYSVKCYWGTVTAKENSIVEITDENGDAYAFNAGKTSVYRVISELGTVEKVNEGEISAAAGTQVAVFTDWNGGISCMVIYK